MIVDLDVHQGNGNSDIFKDNRNVFTFSMHSKSNYPAKKSISDCDVELENDLEDKEYLKILKFYLFLKIKQIPLLQYLLPVGCGPSSKT